MATSMAMTISSARSNAFRRADGLSSVRRGGRASEGGGSAMFSALSFVPPTAFPSAGTRVTRDRAWSGSVGFHDRRQRDERLGSLRALDECHDDEGQNGKDKGHDDVGDGERPEEDDRRGGRQSDDHVEKPALRVAPPAAPPGGPPVLLGVVPQRGPPVAAVAAQASRSPVGAGEPGDDRDRDRQHDAADGGVADGG